MRIEYIHLIENIRDKTLIIYLTPGYRTIDIFVKESFDEVLEKIRKVTE